MRKMLESVTLKTKIRVNIRLDVKIKIEVQLIEYGIILPKIDIMDSLDWEKAIHNEILIKFQELELKGSG